MDDYEYSVEISDRDWKSFFAECEECSLLPPSLAGVDDSGMSDMDEHFLAQRMQRVNSTPNFSKNDLLSNNPLNCVGSPMEHSSGKQGLGVDSILSGSEEDIHMQTINVFFEKLKGLNEVQPGQERVGHNEGWKQEEEDDWRQASRTCPKSKAQHDRVEVGFGKETVEPVDTIRNLNSKKIIEAESNLSSQCVTCSNSAFKPVETELIRNETLRETPRAEKTHRNQPQDSHEKVVCSETTPRSNKYEMCRSMDDINHEGWLKHQEILSKKYGLRKDHVPQELSPSVSTKRKRRKKRRLSMEVDEDESGERHISTKQNDSKEELRTFKGGSQLYFSQEAFDCFKEPPTNLMCCRTSNPDINSFPGNLFAQDTKNVFPHSVSPNESRSQHLHPSRSTETCAAENRSTNHKPQAQLSQNDEVTSAASSPPNEATNLKTSNKLETDESMGRNPFSRPPVSEGGREKSKSQNQEVKTRELERMNTSVSNCEEKQNLKHSTPEVKSVSLLPRGESCAPCKEVCQNEKLSTAKSVLADEAGNSGRDEPTLRQSEAEPRQQQENDDHNTNQGLVTLNDSRLSVFSIQPRACFLPDEISEEVACTSLKMNMKNQPPICCLSEIPSGEDKNQEMDCTLEVQTSNNLSKNCAEIEKTQLKPSQILNLTSPSLETKVSLSDDVKRSPLENTYVPSGCSLDAKSVTLNSNTNFTDTSPSLCLSATENESVQADQKEHVSANVDDKDEDAPGATNRTEPKSDSLSESEEAASKGVDKPEKMENSAFAMSSFWNEMEKLTINDILGLKKLSKAAPPGPLPALQESEEADVFPGADLGLFTPMEESKPEHTIEEIITDSSSLKSVSWENEPVPMSPGSDINLESPKSVSDTSQPFWTEVGPKCLRKIAKTVSVHNLQALDSKSLSYVCSTGTMQILEEQQSESLENLTEKAAPVEDKESHLLTSSSTDGHSFSFTDIFQYLFGGKQEVSSPSATEDQTSYYTSGNSVPETYDHFFSEFECESFFYPLTTVEEETKDKAVPIYSYSRSTTKNIQFPEAYEHFFASSSSDDSSMESDDEDMVIPVKVVSRFTRKVSSTQLSKDMYEDFFSDRDLRENFFSLKSLSFRKMNFSAPADQTPNPNFLVPMRQTHQYNLKIGAPPNVMGDQDVFPDPLLYNRISRQLALESFTHQELQATVSDPSEFVVMKEMQIISENGLTSLTL